MEANKERRALYMATYNAARKDAQKAYDAERYLRPENVAKREANKGEKKEYMRLWILNNKEKHRAADGRRKAQKRGNKIGATATIVAWIKRWRALDSARCYWCQKMTPTVNCHSDHVIPLSKGGAHSIENLCISCEDCNRRKHDRQLPTWNQFLLEPVLL